MPDILKAMLDNQKIFDLFSDLFSTHQFSRTIIYAALGYYMKVFGNVRAKDLCYRYNSNIHKGNTVGLRQQLAGGKKGGKKDIKEEDLHRTMKSVTEEDLDTCHEGRKECTIEDDEREFMGLLQDDVRVIVRVFGEQWPKICILLIKYFTHKLLGHPK